MSIRSKECLLFLLFGILLSLQAVPSGGIISHGLFGEAEAVSFVQEEKEETAVLSQAIREIQKAVKGLMVFCSYLLLVILVICLQFTVYQYRLPKVETMVTRKVRMDH